MLRGWEVVPSISSYPTIAAWSSGSIHTVSPQVVGKKVWASLTTSCRRGRRSTRRRGSTVRTTDCLELGGMCSLAVFIWKIVFYSKELLFPNLLSIYKVATSPGKFQIYFRPFSHCGIWIYKVATFPSKFQSPTEGSLAILAQSKERGISVGVIKYCIWKRLLSKIHWGKWGAIPRSFVQPSPHLLFHLLKTTKIT